MSDDSDEVIPVKRSEFENLRQMVHSLERKVETQQEQIAMLKRRTTTETKNANNSDEETTVPRSAVAREVLAILREKGDRRTHVEVDEIKQRAAVAGHLRSEAKAVVRRWLNEGYLAGDLDGAVKVTEWPSDQTTIG